MIAEMKKYEPPITVDLNDCWLYAKSITNTGYGVIFGEGKTHAAHRVMYTNMVGEIPKGLEIDHLCRVRRCINPAHLEAVTTAENVRRGAGVGVINALKTHCIRGHALSGYNCMTVALPPKYKPERRCRTCQNKTANEYYYRKKKRNSLTTNKDKSDE